MANINWSEIETSADTHRDTEHSAVISLQPAGIASLWSEHGWPRTDILANDALRLLQIIKPSSVTIRNGDAVNCSQWWENLKKPFGGSRLKNVKFVISGICDSLKLNILEVTPVVKEVVAMLASKKPPVFYIRVTEDSIVISAVSQKPTNPKIVYTFEIEVVGDWEWKFTCAKLLADVLPDQLCNLRKVYLVFCYKCQTCVERVFKKMNWTFPSYELHKDARVFLSSVEANELFFDSHAATRQKFNEFTLAATNTKVRYFFEDRKVLQTAFAFDPNYRTLAGEIGNMSGC